MIIMSGPARRAEGYDTTAQQRENSTTSGLCRMSVGHGGPARARRGSCDRHSSGNSQLPGVA